MANEIIGLKEAAGLAGVSEVAVLKWCRKLGIGERREGRWHIDRSKLREVIKAREVLRVREPVA